MHKDEMICITPKLIKFICPKESGFDITLRINQKKFLIKNMKIWIIHENIYMPL